MLNVRDAVPEDAAAVAAVHVRSWQVAYRGLMPEEFLNGLRAEDRMTRYTFGDTRPGRPVTMVAIAGEAICGFVTTGPTRDHDTTEAGEVYALYVDPSAWRQSVGKILLSEAHKRLQGQDFAEAFLWVLADNEQARSFYQAQGWQPDGHRRQERIGDVSLTEVRYRHHLDRDVR